MRRVLLAIIGALVLCVASRAQTPISSLPSATPASTDAVPFVTMSTTPKVLKKTTLSDFFSVLTPSFVQSANEHGNGSKFQLFTGSSSTNDCAKFDSAGNIVTNGGTCAAAAPVQSVFGRTGAVSLLSSDVTGAIGFTPENAANKDAASGYAGLDSGARLKVAEFPALTGDTQTSAGSVATTTKQLHLTETAITNANSPYSLAATDSVITCDASGGAVTITLPAATGSGRYVSIKKIDSSANACTPTRAGTDTIDGATSYGLTTQYAASNVIDTASGTWSRMHVNQLGGDLSGISTAATVSKVNGNTPGGTCTNQFVRSLSSSAVPTCASVDNASLSNSTISGVSLGGTLASHSAGTGLTGSAYNGSAPQSWSVTNPVPANLTLTNPASAATFTLAGGKTFTVNNTLTVNATDGITMTTPATSFTAARTDAAQTFTGVQTFSNGINLGNTNFTNYTEGTWTPAVNFGGATTGITYTTQVGRYTQTGDVVTVWITIVLSSKGTATGSATISGLPTNAANVTGFIQSNAADIYNATYTGATFAFINPASSLSAIQLDVTNNGTRSSMTDANFGNTTAIQFTMQYRTN